MVALVFTGIIMVALWAVRSFVVPALQRRFVGWHSSFLNEGLLYMATSLLGSLVAAVILNATLMPGFLGDASRMAVFAMFSLLFAGLYRGRPRPAVPQELDRARAAREGDEPGAPHPALVPAPRFPEKARLEVHAVNVPLEAAGDFYDVVPAGDALLLAVADVAGKGVPAALLTSMLQASLRTQMTRTSVADILPPSTHLLPQQVVHQFATFFLIRLQDDGGSRTRTPGTIPGALAARRHERVTLERGGTWSASWRPRASRRSAELAAGDRVVVYTDGITEAENAAGEQFGEERLHAAMAELSARAPRADHLLRACARSWTASSPATT